MRYRLPGFAFALAAALLAQLPASLLDPLLAQASGGQFRLELASGSLWSGQGRLLSRPPQRPAEAAALPLSWSWQAARLAAGELAWQFASGERQLGELGIGWQGLRLSRVDLQLPVAFVLAGLPHPLAHLGWGGDFRLRVDDWRCSGAGRCAGNARLAWLGASSAYFPAGRLGDYELQLAAHERGLSFAVRTLAGAVRVGGSGRLDAGQAASFVGTIDGDSPWLQRLPNIAGGAVCPAAAGPGLRVRLPADGGC